MVRQDERHVRRSWAIALLSLLSGLTAAPALSAPEGAEPAIDLRRKANLEGLGSQKRVDELADQTEVLFGEYRSLTTQIEALEVYNSQLEALIGSQDAEIRQLIRRMSRENATWGSPRIQSELALLGYTVDQSTVAKYMVRHRRPPSQTWRTFLENHVGDIAAFDFFVGGASGHSCDQKSQHKNQC